MKNELLSIGPFTVYGYGLMIAVGIVAAYFLLEKRIKKCSFPEQELPALFLVCLVGGFLGAKILFLITVWGDFIKDPILYLQNLSDGFVVYGGLWGGVLGGALFCRRKRISFDTAFDMAAPCIALAQGFGRLGCFLAGCCYGRETSHAFSVVFQTSAFAPNGVSLIPTQIYSAVGDFILCLFLLLYDRRQHRDGQTGLLYLTGYSAGRFVLEFFRGDLERGSIGKISTSQFLALLTIFAVLAWQSICMRKGKE